MQRPPTPANKKWSKSIESRREAATAAKMRKVERAIHLAITVGLSEGFGHPLSKLRLTGPPGIGKTSVALAMIEKQFELEAICLSLANIRIEDLVLPAPDRKTVVTQSGVREEFVHTNRLYKRLLTPHAKVLVLDDFSRAPKPVLNSMLELLSEGTINGQPVVNLVAVIALDNPETEDNFVVSLDKAQAERFSRTLEIGANDIAWREYQIDRYRHRDLAPLHKYWESLPSAIRLKVPPRVLSAMIENADDGWGSEVALGDQRLLDANGDDRTENICVGFNRTLGLPRVTKERASEPVREAVRSAIERDINVRIIGHPGFAKTSFVRTFLQEVGVRRRVFSLSTTRPTDFVIPIPSQTEDGLPAVDLTIMEQLVSSDDDPYCLVADEYSRATRATHQALMPVLQERLIGGRPVTGLRGVVALDNPVTGKNAAFQYDVQDLDLAQKTRFSITLHVGDDGINWQKYLLGLYPGFEEVVQQFITWRAEELNEAEKRLVSPRLLQNLIEGYLHGVPLEEMLPVVDGSRIPIVLNILKHTLETGQTFGLSELLDQQDEVARVLRDDPPETRTYREVILRIQHAFNNADLNLIDSERDRIVRWLVAVDIPYEVKMRSVSYGSERADKWRKLYEEQVRRADRAAIAKDHERLMALLRAGTPQAADQFMPTPEEQKELNSYYTEVAVMNRFLENTDVLSDTEWEENKLWLAEAKFLQEKGLSATISLRDARWDTLEPIPYHLRWLETNQESVVADNGSGEAETHIAAMVADGVTPPEWTARNLGWLRTLRDGTSSGSDASRFWDSLELPYHLRWLEANQESVVADNGSGEAEQYLYELLTDQSIPAGWLEHNVDWLRALGENLPEESRFVSDPFWFGL